MTNKDISDIADCCIISGKQFSGDTEMIGGPSVCQG